MLSILRPKTEEITEAWLELNDEERCDFFSYPTLITDNQVQEDKRGVACSMYETRHECIENFGKKRKGRENLRGIVVVGKKILKYLRNICDQTFFPG
jgi:hypothetical protein